MIQLIVYYLKTQDKYWEKNNKRNEKLLFIIFLYFEKMAINGKKYIIILVY